MMSPWNGIPMRGVNSGVCNYTDESQSNYSGFGLKGLLLYDLVYVMNSGKYVGIYSARK